LRQIHAQTSLLTRLPHPTQPVLPITPQISMIPHIYEESQMMIPDKVSRISMRIPHTRENRLASLARIAEPIGVLRGYQYHIQMLGIDMALSGGRLVVKRWSRSGKEIHTTLPQSEGHHFSLIMSMPKVTSRRLKVSVAGYRTRSCDPTLNFRWMIRYHRVLAYDHPHFVAIKKDDICHLQNQLSSNTLCLSDRIAGGHSMLHVSITRG
jgi:hypothetical protein